MINQDLWHNLWDPTPVICSRGRVMMLKDFLSQKRAVILKKWLHLILQTYPPDSSSFLHKEKNRFANPVGNTISQSIEAIFDELLKGVDSDKVSPFLDN
ncbi:MAG: RsbRD N-terminal domain-containing protein, partial [Desulfatiglandales bacterium]